MARMSLLRPATAVPLVPANRWNLSLSKPARPPLPMTCVILLLTELLELCLLIGTAKAGGKKSGWRKA